MLTKRTLNSRLLAPMTLKLRLSSHFPEVKRTPLKEGTGKQANLEGRHTIRDRQTTYDSRQTPLNVKQMFKLILEILIWLITAPQVS